MSIRVVCDDCGGEFRAKDEHAGRKVNCPSCDAAIRIPDPDSPRRSARPASRSSRTTKSSAGMPSWGWGVIGGAGVVIAGLVVMLVFRGGPEAPPVANQIAAQPASSAPTTADPTVANNAAPAAHAAMASPTNPTPAQSAMPSTAVASAAPVVQPTSVTTPMPTGVVQPIANATPTQPMATPATTPTSPMATGNAAPVVTAARDKPYASVADLVEAVEPSVVRITISTAEGEGAGSGYVIDTAGTIVTNRHVIEGAIRCTARFRDDKKTEYPITGLYYVDEKRDIAIVKIAAPKEKLHPLSLAKDLPRKGEELVAFGAPLGLDFTATQGIVSAVREAEELLTLGIPDYEGTWLQHSVPISPGNSGGPLVNMKGEVVGMNTMTITIGQNLNFAISAKDVADGVTKKQSTALPIRQGTVPERKGRSRQPTPPKDIVGTDQAKEFLGKIGTMEIIMLRAGFDPRGRLTATVKDDFEKALNNAKIRTQRGGQSFMIVGMEIDEAGGTKANQALTISTTCYFRDEGGQVYKIWEERDKVGTLSEQLLFEGGMPKTMRANISKYFQKFSGAVNRSKNEAKKAASTATSSSK